MRVLDILDERGLTQQDLADKMKVTRQYVSKILKGQENMTFETVDKLEKALGIELAEESEFRKKECPFAGTPFLSFVFKSFIPSSAEVTYSAA